MYSKFLLVSSVKRKTERPHYEENLETASMVRRGLQQEWWVR